MDPRKSDGNSTAEQIDPQQRISADQNFDIDYQKLRESLHDTTQTTLNRIDKIIQDSSKKSNKRLYLELIRALIVDSAQTSESLFFLFEYVTDLRASMILLSMEMDKANGKTSKEVKRLKTKISNLLTSPAVVEIGKILQNMQKISEANKNKSDDKPVQEYLR